MRISTILIGSALLLATSITYADDHKSNSNNHIEKITKKLELTTDQSEKFKSIMKEGHLKIKAIRAETKEKINAILSPEQQAKMAEMRAKRMKKHSKKDNH